MMYGLKIRHSRGYYAFKGMKAYKQRADPQLVGEIHIPQRRNNLILIRLCR